MSLSAAGRAATLQEAAQQSVLKNPEVQARWHAFTGAVAEQDAARGGYFPRVDITASTGREYLSQPNLPDSSFNRRNVSASLSQMLFDGFATRDEVRRQGYTKLVRYFELLDASETAALEASRAYYDVLRYRKLIGLAEENYAQHKLLFDLVAQRAKVGVGRRVDVEQAGGRLALAESNLLTEVSNLHDVSARYQRVVGDLPPTDMAEAPQLQQDLPSDPNEAVAAAIQQNPTVAGAIEGIRAAQAALDGRGSAFSPRVDLRARQDLDRNRDGILGNRNDRAIEVVLNYNLFRGGSDSALKRQAGENLNAAKDVRDRTCRDVRQTLAIAFNDTRRLGEQLGYLNTHQLATEKARDAYRKQFDIGQRSLLDLLDTENELFQARRAYANASYDQSIAYARTQAAIGRLLAALKLRRIEPASADALGEERFAVDAATACPPEAPLPYPVDKAAIVARVAALNPLPESLTALSPNAGAKAEEARLQQALDAWVTAWKTKNAGAYFALYATDFKPSSGVSHAAWVSQRRERLAGPQAVQLSVDEIKIQMSDASHGTTAFRQHYRSGAYRDETRKILHWERAADGQWRITQESSEK